MTDDKIQDTLTRLVKERELDGGKEALYAVVASIPFAGGSISSMLTGGAIRRVVDRAEDVFKAVRERLEKVEKFKIDEEFFKTDEFMTILLLAIEQLQTTHDKKKLEMLANAIANSGVVGFSSDSRKELFMRIMRDLSPEHVSMLAAMRPNPVLFTQTNPTGVSLTVLQSLAAHGLVEESYERTEPMLPRRQITSQHEATKIVAQMIASPTTHRFGLSEFGANFLDFFN